MVKIGRGRFAGSAQRGFSLIEILVIIIIIGIIAGITWPRLAALAPRYRLEGAARALAAELQKARGRAIAEGKCFQVTFDVGARTYQVLKAPSSACASFANDGLAQKVEDSGTIGIEDANSSGSAPPPPTFNTRGGNAQASSIRLFNNLGDGRLVTVNGVGRVNVQ